MENLAGKSVYKKQKKKKAEERKRNLIKCVTRQTKWRKALTFFFFLLNHACFPVDKEESPDKFASQYCSRVGKFFFFWYFYPSFLIDFLKFI